MTEAFTLNQLKVGESMTVISVGGAEAMKCRLEDLGLVEGTRITCLMTNPMGDPKAYLIRGAVIALRGEDAVTVSGKLHDSFESKAVPSCMRR